VAVVSTGAGVAVPFAWVGRLFGVPMLYVESFTRIDDLSLTARLISPVASRLYVQWPELAGRTSWLRFAGTLFLDR
jgi:beta-1,4-N-acetylglucosaminyltransferase